LEEGVEEVEEVLRVGHAVHIEIGVVVEEVVDKEEEVVGVHEAIGVVVGLAGQWSDGPHREAARAAGEKGQDDD